MEIRRIAGKIIVGIFLTLIGIGALSFLAAQTGLVSLPFFAVDDSRDSSITDLPAVPSPVPTSTPVPTPTPRILDGGYLFNLVNDYRLKNGHEQMSWYIPFCEYADVRSRQIGSDWSHNSFETDAREGGVIFTRYCPECNGVGENLAKDFSSEESILRAWTQSPAHLANLVDDWDYACAMIYSNKYASMIFGKKK